MGAPETFHQYLERTLADIGLRSYGHNEIGNRAAEQLCYQRAVDCFYGPGQPPKGDDGPPWGIHTPDPEEAHHGAALGGDALPHLCRGIGIVDTVSTDWYAQDDDGNRYPIHAALGYGAPRHGVNPKDQVAEAKVPMWSLPAIGAVHGAMSTADGIRKGYGPYNWREKPISMMEHIGALERHIAALKDGEDFTRDSNVTHLGCVIAGASIILDAQQGGTLIDDRPTPGVSTSADALEDYSDRNSKP